MPKPIGFHATSGLIVIDDNGVFAPRSLTAYASPMWPGRIQIDNLASKGIQNVLWGDVTSLDGSYTPATMGDALAYLQGEFSKSTPVRPTPVLYPLSGAASFAISHGLSYAPMATIIGPDGTEVDTDVAHAPGLTTLTFAQPFTGTLYLG
ncbi:hypothetical protein [Methylobacterium mesophilicum]